MTKKQKDTFEKIFSDFETIKQFLPKKMMVPQEEDAFDDVYSIIDALYCEYSTEYKTESVAYSVRVRIKEKYNDSLFLWAPTRYLEMLEAWYDYLLYNDELD